MANSVIGSGAVVLTANADQLLTGLSKAQSATEKWASATTKKTNAVADANHKSYDALVAKGNKLAGYMADVDYSKPMGGKGKSGGGAGGALAGGLAGGIAGFAAGAALDGLKAAAGFVAEIPEMLKSLKEAGGQGEGGPLGRMVASIEMLQALGVQFLATVVSPMAPAFERVAQLAQGFWQRLQPIAASLGGRIGGALFSLVEMTGSWLGVLLTGLQAVWPILDRVFRAAEVGLFVFESLFTAVVDGISWVIQSVAEWVGSWLNLQDVTVTVSQAMFAALKVIAQGAGHVWDTFKYGAGVIAEALGGVVELALRGVIQGLRSILELVTALPSRLQPAGLDKFLTFLDKADASAAGIGGKIEAWGKSAQKGFGESAGVFGAAIDALQAKFEERQQKIADAAHKTGEMLTKVELAPAMLSGSNEAYSTIVKNQVGGLFAEQNRMFGTDEQLPANKDPIAIAQKQLTAAQDARRILAKIEGNLSGALVLGVIP